MPFAPVDSPALIRSGAEIFSRFEANGEGSQALRTDYFDVLSVPIQKLEVGETVYPLRRATRGTFFPGSGGEPGEFWVEGFSPPFVGEGTTPDEAFSNWRNQVHVRFQELYVKRPFELDVAEAATWKVLTEQINVGVYANQTPFKVKQFGQVQRARPWPELIRWENGSGESVRLDQMPGEFASYKAGQCFEALAVRDPVNFRLLRVEFIKRTARPAALSQKDIDALWKAMPTTESLPDTEWD
jgi:hypothetical protein